MAKTYDYDVLVIGGGPAGYPAAIRASQLGARTACVEKGPLGGTCTNTGCIPTKVMVHAARLLQEVRDAAKVGVVAENPRLDYAGLVKHRDAVVQVLRGGVESLLKANGVELIRGAAAFTDAHTVQVKADGKPVSLTADKIMVATGAQPVEVPVAPFDGRDVISSTGALALEELPGSLLIVGGGYIGCEFACIFAALGVQVTVVEMLDQLLPGMDADCGREVARHLKKAGAKVLTGVGVNKVHKGKGGLTAELADGRKIKADKVLVCVGRRPTYDGLDLARAGVKTTEKGVAVVNAHMQTSVPTIYAIGDAAGGILLAHVASYEGLVAAAHATGRITAAADYRVVPACVFTIPEVASVGMTEEQARKAAGEVTVKKFPMRALGKAHAARMTDGFTKMICNAKTGEVLGVHIVSAEASNLIAEAALAIRLQATAEELADTIHAHPTMPECMREVAEGVLGKPIDWTG